MPEVFRLAYADMTSASMDEAEDYYGRVLGASVVEKADGAVYFSLGLDHHNIAIRQGDAPGLNAIGLQTDPDVPLVDLSRRLRDAGFATNLRTDSRPGVPVLLEVPDAGGQTFHLFPSIAQPAPGFAVSGIVPLRLGHVALMSTKADEMLRLVKVLGFRETDWFDEIVTFLTCNRDHHVLNFIQAPVVGVHHIAFEMRGFEHHAGALERLAHEKRPVEWGPSRHTAGHNIASYHFGADGLLVEFYTEMDIFVPELNMFEPRPWHEALPQRPKRWNIEHMTTWETRYEFSLATVAWGVKQAA